MDEVFIYTRSLEIVISILAGTFLCYLGSRLFQGGFNEKSELKFEYGKLKLNLLKATPGIFFSLFGAVIIIGVVWRSATFSEESKNKNGTTQKTTITKSIENEDSRTELSSLQARFHQAIDLHRNDAIEEAETIYKEILKMEPVIGQVANNLADIQKNRGDLESALILVNFAVSVFPDSVTFQKTLQQTKAMWRSK